jgi:hypothetical protein
VVEFGHVALWVKLYRNTDSQMGYREYHEEERDAGMLKVPNVVGLTLCQEAVNHGESRKGAGSGGTGDSRF